jgi:hypothetical protein
VAFLTLTMRRFLYLFCSKVFTEQDEVFGPMRRSSYRFREYLGKEDILNYFDYPITNGFVYSEE